MLDLGIVTGLNCAETEGDFGCDPQSDNRLMCTYFPNKKKSKEAIYPEDCLEPELYQQRGCSQSPCVVLYRVFLFSTRKTTLPHDAYKLKFL